MPLFRSKAEQKVRDAGYDPARLPPGQYLTEKWPVLHAGEVPDVDLATKTAGWVPHAQSSSPATRHGSRPGSPPAPTIASLGR